MKKRQKQLRKMARKTIANLNDNKFNNKININEKFTKIDIDDLNQYFNSPKNQKISLPIGTIRKVHQKYEEVIIPVSKKKHKIINEVSTDVFDELTKEAFSGIDKLNAIQSESLFVAFHTNENILVCAPTGAGKTNIAIMTILRLIKSFYEESDMKINKKNASKFKIVYITPMKALAKEIVSKFTKRLKILGVITKELTGDINLTKKEISLTHIIVTTPEKWDVITRKNNEISKSIRLLIVDEIHLLNEERGSVIECIIARTKMTVESLQTPIRLVGLSATLPNYQDVSSFLKVDPSIGLLYFDESYRPVPMSYIFEGVSVKNQLKSQSTMNLICYEKMTESLIEGKQVLIFVHSRIDTNKTALYLIEMLKKRKNIGLTEKNNKYINLSLRTLNRKKLSYILENGIGIHHAGMSRSDRDTMEKLFSRGNIKVLVSTATLAWGVNLPAHTVIIKGTSIYNPEKGGFVDMGGLDLMQIFGRAGRPQFDTSGKGILITTQKLLYKYLGLLMSQIPIESQFINNIENNLNAEITLGSVTNLSEAINWLAYSYLYIRILRNPLHYGITYEDCEKDIQLVNIRESLILNATKKLVKCELIRFTNNVFFPTNIGRISSHYYIHYESIDIYMRLINKSNGFMNNEDILYLMSISKEFEQIKLKDEEMNEIENMAANCPIKIRGGTETVYGKVNILIQTYISRYSFSSHTLNSDMMYISQNIVRIARAIFEICINQNYPILAKRFLSFSKMCENQIWEHYHPLRQFNLLSLEIIKKIEDKKLTIENINEEDVKNLGLIIRNMRSAKEVKRLSSLIPSLIIDAVPLPITKTILKIKTLIIPNFKWNSHIHSSTEHFWIWIEDIEGRTKIYSKELISITKKNFEKDCDIIIEFIIPIPYDSMPSQLIIRAISNRWFGSETSSLVRFKHLILPEDYTPNTKLMNLHPLSVKALHNKNYESLYPFNYFNPIQTQIFHVAYHTIHNILLGAPTGSGKTAIAELAILHLLNSKKRKFKIVYIAPLKALAREKYKDWKNKFEKLLSVKVSILTGDITPESKELIQSIILITTPEKWDGISRNWKNRNYVRRVQLLIIDEIHLLGTDRGPIIEMIVTRTRFISEFTNTKCRIIGLSTALANSYDLANWLGIDRIGVYNFHNSIRPVPLSVHISGYPGRNYCPRMNLMNKPCYQAIKTYSANKPVIIFVSSRRQTRLTAFDLINYYSLDNDNPSKWTILESDKLKLICESITDENLKNALEFGVGIHHAGLIDNDRKLVEELFINNKIKILICTSTLAWGVNFPAHLVCIKGTEYYDAKVGRYVDMPLTDILQMMGRAGRPQFDSEGIACIFVHEPKKGFYSKFLNEPFPVESNFHKVLHNHINAEVASGTINNFKEGMEFLKWTYLYRRLTRNPTYYMIDSNDNTEENKKEAVTKWLSGLLKDSIYDLEDAECIKISKENNSFIQCTSLGKISSYYYIDYKTVSLFNKKLISGDNIENILKILCESTEYEELPVRHNEDKKNESLSLITKLSAQNMSMDSPLTKAYLLYQAHMQNIPLPISDYETDLRSVLDQSIRILSSMIDVILNKGYLDTMINIINLMQLIISALWIDTDPMVNLPFFDKDICTKINHKNLFLISQMTFMKNIHLKKLFKEIFKDKDIDEFKIIKIIRKYPLIKLSFNTNKNTYKSGEHIIIDINLKNLTGYNGNINAPKWNKPRKAGWFLILCSITNNYIINFKKIYPFKCEYSVTFNMKAPNNIGENRYDLIFLSDSYVELDQQYKIKIIVNEFC